MLMSMTYPGGKGRLYQQIISLMPPHRIYIETHLGLGTVLRKKRPAESSFGIDKDEAAIARCPAPLPPNCTLVAGDAVGFLAAFRFLGGELVYSDPPYLPSTRRRRRVYRCDYNEADHVALLDALRELPCPVMLSGYPNDLYDGILAGWRRVEFAGPTQTGNRTEALWMNFEQPITLHDHAHIGRDFRERERIRRRRQRLVARMRHLDPHERHALLAAVAAIDGTTILAAPPQPPTPGAA